jgi:hypothetical protein
MIVPPVVLQLYQPTSILLNFLMYHTNHGKIYSNRALGC